MENFGYIFKFLKQYILLMGNIVICKIVAATAMPTDADPKYRATILAIGAATVDYATATARLEIDSLNKRLGELRNYDTAEKRVWVRFKGGDLRGGDDS